MLRILVNSLAACLFGLAALASTHKRIAAAPAEHGSPVSFDRDVRPILSDKCFQCHGPDVETREADLRLDEATGLANVVDAANPEASELLRRVLSGDDDERMPPADSGLAVSPAEKETLRRWIAAGAKFGGHWSFDDLPQHIRVPPAGDGWARSSLDRFVANQLKTEGLEPAAEASPERLLRRAALDLTGLPPTVELSERFERDVTAHGLDNAYAKVVDQLLASPAYGEHLAVAWLDAARYADSYGYQSDQLRTQWPYRDWVVQAFNDNLPYDKFVTWQLAGDLLPDATREQILATAFNRLHRMTNEGGSLSEEWRLENAVDRVNVFGTAILGLTLECARCHDHKYDPITQRDYFSILAFFNSIDENGLYDHALKTPSPSLLLPNEEQESSRKRRERQCEQAETKLAAVASRPGVDDRLLAWLKSTGAGASIPDCVGKFDFEGDLARLPNLAAPNQPSVDAKSARACDGVQGRGVAFDGDQGIEFPELLPVDRWNPWSIALWLRDVRRDDRPVVLAQRTFGTDVGYNGTDVTLEAGHVTVRIYRVWPGNGIGVRTKSTLPRDAWQHLAVTYDGSSRAAGIKIFIDGRPVDAEVLRDHLEKTTAVRAYGAGHFTIGARFRDRGFADGQVDDLRLFRRALAPLEILELHSPGTLAAAIAAPANQMPALRKVYLSAQDDLVRTAQEELTAKRREFAELEESFLEVAVMRELPTPRPTYALARGAYDAPKSAENRVDRDVFAQILPRFPAGAPRDRRGLATWATEPDHPLVARVFVNRLWTNFFGRGLVGTPENFGSQGAPPTHRELLDWLARDFVAHGWDVKRLCREIVLSATYRQDSRTDAATRQRDPENILLARGSAFRLSAEQTRDLALASSGLLMQSIGGPPVSPYQPGEDLWREANAMSPPYKQSVGKALYRRSLYSVWKRTAPLPNMTAFDAPTREVCTVNRSRTNTPLQSLVLLNDEQFVEAARALAQQVMRTPTGAATTREESQDSHASLAADAIEQAMRRAAGRRPTDDELSILSQLYAEQCEQFAAAPLDDVAKFLAIGESAHAATPSPELAAMTVVCQTILNLDAAVTRR